MSKSSSYRCVVSAGPTREFLDPFRFISNPSTGKMGYAIAAAAVEAGWSVDLVSGPTALDEPEDCIFYPVESGEEMLHQIDALYDVCDILIMTAAVVDFRPTRYLPEKEKKTEAARTLELEPVPDILKTLNQRKKHQYVVGFAAETRDLETYARGKLEAKNLDLIAANLIGESGAGFADDTNRLIVLGPDDFRLELGPSGKKELGHELVRLIDARLRTRNPNPDHPAFQDA